MKIGFLGVGNMGGAILQGLLKTTDEHEFWIYDKDASKMDAFENVFKAGSFGEMISHIDYLFIAVKPYHVAMALKGYEQLLKDKVIISMALGISRTDYQELLNENQNVLIMMPNTPCKVLEGTILFDDDYSCTQNDYKQISNLLSHVAYTELVSHDVMGIAGTLTGCGPAFIYTIIEGLADGAVKYGVPRQKAYDLASNMVLGSAKMVLETKEHPAKLKDDVCSPNGSTIRGVEALYEYNIHKAMMEAVSRSYKNEK